MILSGWGRVQKLDCHVSRPTTEADVAAALARGPAIARGNGRAYGDSALNAGNTIDMRNFNRMLAFDAARGQLTVEAGVLLGDIIQAFLPRGWFPPVTPGTKFVTIGGMIAADVHGKNHHLHGTFGNFVDWIDVMGHDHQVYRCTPEQNSELFNWTIGGMGLTGVILRASFRMLRVESAWITQRLIAAQNIADAMDIFDANAHTTYSVAWIDCLSKGPALGRSIVMLGEHTKQSELPASLRMAPFATKPRPSVAVPADMPSILLNKWSMRLFNETYFRRSSRSAHHGLIDWERYFYPLDALLKWNRIYGRRGLIQFQCALPLNRSKPGMTGILEAISRSRTGSFLSVLKRFGQARGGLSFPMAGYTLACDFPASPDTVILMAELERLTIANGGRLYLAKDSCMTPESIRLMEPRLAAWLGLRETNHMSEQFTSVQSERLKI